ncbi:MAG TPA: hypothetical protein VFI12_00780, partial [Thermomicrobiales bacterium]|nr:hypothetical protein [Thermomicrobiales bacterium]
MAHLIGRNLVSRRAIIGGALVAGAFGVPGSTGRRAARAARATSPETWRTWLLDSPDELRPPDPGDPAPAERDELIALQSRRSVETGVTVSRWGDGPAVLPWSGIAL